MEIKNESIESVNANINQEKQRSEMMTDEISFEKRGQNLIEHIIEEMVDEPEKVQVKPIKGEQTYVFELTVSRNDLGKVIGKQGKTAKAIRTILTNFATKNQKRAVLEIVE